MRNSTSLSDITSVVCDVVPANHPTALGILSSLPALQGTTIRRLAVFCSSAAIFNSQLSAAQQQIRLLQASNATLKDTVKALSAKKEYLVAENDALLQAKLKLENEKRKLVDELRVERFQGSIRVRKAREDKKTITDLLGTAKQRDYFVRALIDIKLDQPVLTDAYVVLQNGKSADQAIVEAIRSAANKHASPWSSLLGPVDVSKTDLYKSAIELAATARLQLDESIRLARFWKHVAKYSDQNVGIMTPSPSALEAINLELQKEERDTVLDDLLDRLRSGEDIRKEDEKKRPFFAFPDTLYQDVSPTSVTHHKDSRETGSGLSVSTLDSDSYGKQPTDPATIDVVSSRDSDFFAPGNRNATSFLGPSSSLERIYGVFTTTSSEETVNDHEQLASNSLGCLSIPICSLQPISVSAAGRGRSATFPFSKRDLTLPPVRDVICGLAVVTLPGDKEREVQAMAGQRARFYSETSLMRSKAVTNRRRQGPLRLQISKSLARKSRTANVSTPITSKPAIPPLSIRNMKNLPTPPPEGDSIAYIRPPTVTRKNVIGPLSDGTPSTVSPVSPISPTRVSSFPRDQKIKPYIVRGPLPSSTYERNTLADGVFPRTLNRATMVPPKNMNQIKKKTKLLPIGRISESDKENISPQTRSNYSPRRHNFGSPTASSRIPIGSPPRLKVVQPLRIIKKNPIQKTFKVCRVS
ncbi:hypothetical protein Agabi119p4_1597 [Agaricus bisporus var. burnettii]|uniref:Uncharacterized protein n=1 Tax=Agaricus bisporus var. burnettii TaxID=192524 RepID=A0A8H7KJ98_AGABI|nr:hypothetical protein Agabi119p4_1597 [Agaricus bisporus var. burnettii]